MADDFVRTPASSANLGAGFDVLGMAVTLTAEAGFGDSPDDAQPVDARHPAHVAFEALGGTGPIWLRSRIPVARGLGFSGAVRVAGAALGALQRSPGAPLEESAAEILRVVADLEGHGDNAAASLVGGVTAFVDGRAVALPVGPNMARASFVAWIPDVTTSTDRSRRSLDATVARADAVYNIGRALQLASAFAHDDPALLVGATGDRLHQAQRLPLVPGAVDALDAGVGAGAWCGWLSGSGPTVGLLCDASIAQRVAEALPVGGHTKVLAIDVEGTRVVTD